ncbi:MAG TPA: hypothetical protein IAB27_04155 [Candidatus Coprosoma intestinipullorum]|uniref:DUF6273 domain-containing protein n=1 Tax=Candidatus Coprosoma intestinipullorum TaxID=2840752 RepID=A0A9D1CYA4_9FIRM|nr:hypothetical protein [Candidatus Coprosoma intestinipullorum]
MKNNRGFLLAESLVVSTFVLTVLIFLFVQYQNLMTTYKNNTDYNNPEAIYNLGSFGQYLNADPSRLTSLSDSLGSNAYIRVYDKSSGGCNVNLGLGTFCDTIFNAAGAKKVIYAGSDLTNLKNYIKNNDDSYLNQSLRDFIRRIDADAIENKGRLIAQFDNGYYATVALDTEVISDISTDACIIGGQQISPVTSGDGIYKDEYESGRCVYRGENPNNYIRFNNELWRIIAREADGAYKIVRNEVLPEDMPFDENDYRDSESNGAGGTYCANSSYGCNAWAATANMVGSPSEFTNGDYSGTVLLDSSLNTYLNGEYLNSITVNKDKIVNHDYNIGAVVYNNNDLATQIEGEKAYKWNGKVGLISESDYINANSDMNTCGTLSKYNSKYKTCRNTNWMYISGTWWSLSPDADYSYYVWRVYDVGYLDNNIAYNSHGVRPAVYLTSSLSLSGSGTQSNPFTIQ